MKPEQMMKLMKFAKKLAKRPLGSFATEDEREMAVIIATEVPQLIVAANGGKMPSAKSKPKAGEKPIAAVG
jgi:hypothetical protein